MVISTLLTLFNLFVIILVATYDNTISNFYLLSCVTSLLRYTLLVSIIVTLLLHQLSLSALRGMYSLALPTPHWRNSNSSLTGNRTSLFILSFWTALPRVRYSFVLQLVRPIILRVTPLLGLSFLGSSLCQASLSKDRISPGSALCWAILPRAGPSSSLPFPG